jgi:hypothetical protein
MDMAIYFIIVLVLACLIMSHTIAEENGYRRGVRVGEKKAVGIDTAIEAHFLVIKSRLDEVVADLLETSTSLKD